MASDEAISWIFTSEFIQHKTPSRLDAISFNDELNERQKCASLIQEVAKRTELMQTVANTALCYMHRFYMYHSFKRFRFDLVGPVALFLAAKVEEQPRKLDHIIFAVHRILYRDVPANPLAETRRVDFTETYTVLESVMLQTLGFAIRFDQPHLHIVSSAQKIRGSRDLAQTAWFIATHCLHMSMFFVQYPSEVIACLCIYLACKWANVDMPVAGDQLWIHVVDPRVTIEQLEAMTEELLAIIQRCPAKLKQRMATIRGSNCLPPEVAEKLGIQFNASANGGGPNSYSDLATSTLHRADVDSSDGAQLANMTPTNGGDQTVGCDSKPTPMQQRRVIDVDQYRKRYLDSTTRSGGPSNDFKPNDLKSNVGSELKSKASANSSNAAVAQGVAMKKPRPGSLLSEALKHDSTGRTAPPQPVNRERTTSGSDRSAIHHDKARHHDAHAQPHADPHGHQPNDAHAMHHTVDSKSYNKHDVYRSSHNHLPGREPTVSVSNSDHSVAHGERERDRDRERERGNDRQRERHVSVLRDSSAKVDMKLYDATTVPKSMIRKTCDDMEEGEIDDDE